MKHVKKECVAMLLAGGQGSRLYALTKGYLPICTNLLNALLKKSVETSFRTNTTRAY